jgi:predicted nucleic acid-binding protein
MDAYFDSAIIIKLYVQEVNSAHAIGLVSAYPAPAPLTTWQALEVKNATRLKAFRKEISASEMAQSIAAFEQDIAAKRWIRPDYSVAAIDQKAEELSASHAATLGCRTLDIIHVAAAVVIGVRDFVTFDNRQAALARLSGLTVKS